MRGWWGASHPPTPQFSVCFPTCGGRGGRGMGVAQMDEPIDYHAQLSSDDAPRCFPRRRFFSAFCIASRWPACSRCLLSKRRRSRLSPLASCACWPRPCGAPLISTPPFYGGPACPPLRRRAMIFDRCCPGRVSCFSGWRWHGCSSIDCLLASLPARAELSNAR